MSLNSVHLNMIANAYEDPQGVRGCNDCLAYPYANASLKAIE